MGRIEVDWQRKLAERRDRVAEQVSRLKNLPSRDLEDIASACEEILYQRDYDAARTRYDNLPEDQKGFDNG